MKPFNETAPNILSKPIPQSLGRIYDLVMHCLGITALYTPLVWYALHLRSVYPANTNLLNMDPLHLLIVMALSIAPLLILHKLGVNWRGKENSPPEY